MKLFLYLIIFIIMISIVNAACIGPSNGMKIEENTVFCKGTYSLPDGIDIAKDGIELDCDGGTIKGFFIENGISINEKNNIKIKNCIIKDYEDAVYLKNSNLNTISDNIFSSKRYGIKVIDSFENKFLNNEDNSTIAPIDVINSKFNIIIFLNKLLEGNGYCENNICDNIKEINVCVNNDGYCSLSCTALNDNDCEIEAIETEEIITEKQPSNKEILIQVYTLRTNLTQEEIEEEVDNILSKYFSFTQENLIINRTFSYNPEENITTVSLSITPKKILYNLSLYEYIPKCFSIYLSDIEFIEKNFEIINNDPLIMWHFPVLSEETKFSYKVNKEISEKCKELFRIFGIATTFQEKKIQKTNIIFPLIVVFFTILIVIYFKRLKK